MLLQLKHVIDSDAAMSEDTIAYNIIPLDAPVTTNATTAFPEVRYFLFYTFVHAMWLVLLHDKKMWAGSSGSCSVEVFSRLAKIAC